MQIKKIDIFLMGVMFLAFLVVTLNPVEKVTPENKINISNLLPDKIPYLYPIWKSITFDMSDYNDKWQSINELFVRKYYKRDKKNIDFIVEYSSDMRKNFSFHFPENCHRSGGNEVDFLDPLTVKLDDGRMLLTKLLFIKGVKGSVEEEDKLVAYWLVIDKRHYHQTFWIKVDQMLSGLLKQSKQGFLLRVDYKDGAEYTEEGIERGKLLITEFLKDIYSVLNEQQRELLFGVE